LYTRKALIDLHERSHVSLQKLLEHCRLLSTEDFCREIQGFGNPTVQIQLHHVIAAEKYWISVLEGRMDIDDDPTADFRVEHMIDYRAQVFQATVQYLRRATHEDLNTARTVTTWGHKERTVMPAHVLVRTQVHLYQHQGQILAMCRMFGKPVTGLDFPLD
jgi:uncharacterized damage-inducible protein DinB